MTNSQLKAICTDAIEEAQEAARDADSSNDRVSSLAGQVTADCDRAETSAGDASYYCDVASQSEAKAQAHCERAEVHRIAAHEFCVEAEEARDEAQDARDESQEARDIAVEADDGIREMILSIREEMAQQTIELEDSFNGAREACRTVNIKIEALYKAELSLTKRIKVSREIAGRLEPHTVKTLRVVNIQIAVFETDSLREAMAYRERSPAKLKPRLKIRSHQGKYKVFYIWTAESAGGYYKIYKPD